MTKFVLLRYDVWTDAMLYLGNCFKNVGPSFKVQRQEGCDARHKCGMAIRTARTKLY
ncbi:MAG: hypothetical protein JWQ71_3494 [Pedosphaera sp.]|nr:hypothetical protein [Pedosphaera sp.]